MKKAFITGITGQDGSYLAELLLSKGYEIHGLVRRSSSLNRKRIDHIHTAGDVSSNQLILHYGDLSTSGCLTNLLRRIKPDEIYHLGAQSHVRISFDVPEYTSDVVGIGVLRLLEAIRHSDIQCRFYQASSSEMFGASPAPQNEYTPLLPQSPYAVAKVMAYHNTNNYREAYGIFTSNGILFNHESPRRGENFVTRKITISLANILAGKQKVIQLGNLAAKRDWGFAPEYVEAMWKMLQLDKGDSFVIGTGEMHSVEEFVKEAFAYVDLPYDKYIKIDSRYMRPLEVDNLCADSSKAKSIFGFSPRINFKKLVKIMVDADMERAGLTPIGEGKEILKKEGFDWYM